METIAASYYDGKNAKRHPVHLVFGQNGVYIHGHGIDCIELYSDTQVVEKVLGAPRTLNFSSGARCEILHPDVDMQLEQVGFKSHWIESLYNRKRWMVGACLTCVLVLILGHQVLLPMLGRFVAKTLPSSLVDRAGIDALALLDEHMFKPSTLPLVTQNRLRKKLISLQRESFNPSVQLQFRSSQIGPNAFALPNDTIVMTDELYDLLDDEEAVMGALAHELGHVQEHHLLRKSVQTGLTGVVTAFLFGDTSFILVGLSSSLLDMSYNRDFEREADLFAIELFTRNKLPLQKLVTVHEKLERMNHGADRPGYLSSHPSAQERIETIRQAQTKQSVEEPLL